MSYLTFILREKLTTIYAKINITEDIERIFIFFENLENIFNLSIDYFLVNFCQLKDFLLFLK